MKSDENIDFIGSKYEEQYGFCKARKHNGTIYVSGTSGTNFEKGELSPDANEQLREAFRSVEKALKHFGSSLSDLLQVQLYYSTDEVFEEIGDTLAEHLRDSTPALFAVRADLPLPEFKVELMVIAAARD